MEAHRKRCLTRLAENVRDLWVPPEVPRRPFHSLSPLEFLRDHVAASQPVVLTDLPAEEWPCMTRWSERYLLEVAGEMDVSVNVTPCGLGDYVDAASGLFVKPLEERMRFRDFWALLTRRTQSPARDGIPYLSHQNDSLRDQLPVLLKDVPSAVTLGVAAFGNEPEAVNLWIGDERAMSTCHKDHYENLYAVVQGEKTFTLLPPAMVPFLHERQCAPAQFVRRELPNGSSTLQALPDAAPAEPVPWVPVDVARPNLERFPDFAQATAVQVRVGPGELLYLPAMWYHQVAQQGLTVAVNYWHDMPFGHAYIHHQFIRDVALGTEAEPGEEGVNDFGDVG